MKQIVVLSGPIASGKTLLAVSLCDRFRGVRFSTRELLQEHIGRRTPTRGGLQKAGRQLDEETDGRWLSEALSTRIAENAEYDLAVIDSVRVEGQVRWLREAFGRRVVHIHLTSSPEMRAQRFEARRARSDVKEPSFEKASKDPTEAAVEHLAGQADVWIETDRSAPQDVLARAAGHLGLYGPADQRVVDVLVGGLYGSEGKGNIAYFLAPEYDLLMRVGGPNAGHKVYLPSGDVFTHVQLPSGTRAGNARLLLGPGSVINVDILKTEIADCRLEADRLRIDPQALIIEREDIEAEKKTLEKAIGSTAQGVGAATARRIWRGKRGGVQLAKDIKDLRPYIQDAAEVLEAAYARGERICLEGTQGTGLSLYHGPYPYVTSRDTTASGIMSQAGIGPRFVRRVLMVCRTFPIRVKSPKGSTSGPLTRELTWEAVETRAGFDAGDLSDVEIGSRSKKLRRVGEFEWDLLRRAALLNSPTDIALTFADYIDRRNRDARRFEQLTEGTIRFVEEVERVAGCPVSLIATRFHPQRSVIDRRLW